VTHRVERECTGLRRDQPDTSCTEYDCHDTGLWLAAIPSD